MSTRRVHRRLVVEELEPRIAPTTTYHITDVSGLQAMQNDLAGDYILDNDIDASATSSWDGGWGFAPVGSEGTPFKGSFNGGGHAITRLSICRDQTYGGLFGYATTGSSIANLALVDASITGSLVYAGGLVAINEGAVSDSYVSGSLKWGRYIGGLVGENLGTISNSYSTASVTGDDLYICVAVGGLVGRNGVYGHFSSVSNCYATGRVTAPPGSLSWGGLIGSALVGYSSVSNSYWDTLTTDQSTSAGGTGSTGKTTDEMMQQTTYSGWDFTNTWSIVEGVTYPTLRNVGPALAVDLSWNSLSADQTTVAPGGALTGTRNYQVSNQAVGPDFAIEYRLIEPSGSWGSIYNITLTPDQPITGGKNVGPHSGSFSVTLPLNASPGTYILAAKVDNDNTVSPEQDENNNIISGPQVTVGNVDAMTIFEILARDVAYDTWQAGQSVGYGYTVNQVFNDPSTGFYAVGLTSTTLEPALAVRGTEPTDIADVFSDFDTQGVGYSQYQANRTAVESWISSHTTGTSHVDMVGHSLGGALVQWIAADYTSQDHWLGNVVTFNSPGISRSAAQQFKPSYAENVMHYIVSGDLASMAGQTFIDGDYTLASYSDLNLVDKHVRPLLVDSIGSRTKPGDLALTTYTSLDWLNSQYFCYYDRDYFTWLAAGEIAVNTIPPIPGLEGLKDLPPALLFRGSTEAKRQQIGQSLETIENAMNLQIDPTAFQVKLPEIGIEWYGLLDMDVKDLSLRYQETPTTSLRIQGQVTLPKVFNATADFSGSNYIEIRKDGWDVVGSFSVQDVPIVPGLWAIKSARLWFDSGRSAVKSEATIRIPSGIEVSAGLEFVNKQLNWFSLGANGLSIPIGATGAVLHSISGQVDHLAENGSPPIEFGGSVGATYGPQISLHLPSWAGGDFTGSLVDLTLSGTLDANHLTARGDVKFINGLASGTASAEVNWNQRFVSADAHFEALAGLITADAAFRANANLDLTMSGTGVVNIPDEIPVVGGFELASGSMLLKFTNDGISNNDFVAAWGDIDLPLIGILRGGFIVRFDGTWGYIGGREIDRVVQGSPMPEGRAALREAATLSSIQQTFAVAAGAPYALLGTRWDNATSNAAIRLTDPNGAVYGEGDFVGSTTMAIVPALTGTTRRTVVVKNPQAGNWTLELVDSTGLGQVRMQGVAGTAAPSLQITGASSDMAGTSVAIDYAASDPDSNAQVALYYDNDNQGGNGILIHDGLAESDGPGSYSWNTTDVPPGDYYVYGIVMDENNAPVNSSYFSQPVRVNVAAPSVTIRATDANASETGPDPGVFTVSRTGSTKGDLVVHYALGGTATTGDYVALSGAITIGAGSSSATITVVPIDDTIVEGNETVILTLSTSGAYTIGSSGTATVTIADNDAQPTGTWAEYVWGSPTQGSATGGGISNTSAPSMTPAIAADSNGYPIVAWAEGPNEQEAIYVRRWNGSSWEAIGPSGGIDGNSGGSQVPSIAIGPNGYPTVAWQDRTSGKWQIYVKQWNGSSWMELAGSASGGGITSFSYYTCCPRIAVGTDGKFFVAWHGSNGSGEEVYVRKWTGTAWEQMAGSGTGGGISNDGGVLSNDASIALGTDGNPVVSWTKGDYSDYSGIYLRKWNGSAWIELNGSGSGDGISNDGNYSSVLMRPDGNPIVAWQKHSTGEVYVRRWNGSAWVEMGSGSASGGGISNSPGQSWRPIMVLGADGLPIITWTDASEADTEIYVRRWNGSSWVETGTGSAQAGGISNNTANSVLGGMAADSDGNPIVAWRDDSLGNSEIYVRLYIGGPTLPTVNITATDANASETGPDPGVFTVSRTGSTKGDLVVHYTLGGTATTGDYLPLAGAVTIGAGSSSATITMAPVDDTIVEGNETVILTLSTSGSYTISPSGTATVTIADNDAQQTGTWAEYVWGSPMQGSATGGGISNGANWPLYPVVAVANDGSPVVVWTDDIGYNDTSYYEVYGRRWNGSSWEEMAGSTSGLGISNRPQDVNNYAIANKSGGDVIVAWSSMTGGPGDQVYARLWNGSSWTEMGGSASGKGISNMPWAGLPSIACGTDGNPVVAWIAENGSGSADYPWDLYARRWTGTSWEELGGSAHGGGISKTGGVSLIDLATGPDGNPVVAWSDWADGTNQIYVRAWNGSSWVELGTDSASGGGISNTPGGADFVAMAIGADGNPVVAWTSAVGGNAEVYVRRFDGSSWEELDGSAHGGGISNSPGSVGEWNPVDIGVGTDGNPVVVWSDNTDGNWEIYGRRWDGLSWVEMGPHSASGGGISNDSGSSLGPSIAFGTNGIPVVAWCDDSSGAMEVYVRRYVVDTNAESVPPTGVNLQAVSDTGVSNSDRLTGLDNSAPGKTLQFVVSGTVVGATVVVYSGAASIGSAIATGAITIVTTNGLLDLPDGPNAITAFQKELGYTFSPASPALSMTVDTGPPPAPDAADLDQAGDTGMFLWDNITTQAKPTLDLSGFGTYYRLYRNGEQVSADYGTASQYTEGTSLGYGVYDYSLRAVDAAGNVSAPSDVLQVAIAQETQLALGKASTFGDADGSKVSITLAGAGMGVYTLTNGFATGAPIGWIVLSGTSAKSTLTITTKGGAYPGTTLEHLRIDNAGWPVGFGTITAGSVGVTVGGKIEANASVKTMTLGNISDGTQVLIAGPLGTLTARTVGNGVSVAVGGNLDSFTADSVGTGSQVMVAGAIKTLKTMKGGWGASVMAGGGIGTITVTGTSAGGSLTGNIVANGTAGIGTITVSKGNLTGTISAANADLAKGKGITSITVAGNAQNVNIQTSGKLGTFTVNGTATTPRTLSGLIDVRVLGSLSAAYADLVNLNLTVVGSIGSVKARNVQDSEITAATLGTLQASGDFTGASLIHVSATPTAGKPVSSITIGGNLQSTASYAIQIDGSLATGAKIDIGGTASSGTGAAKKNRIKIGDELDGQISIGTKRTVTNGMFGDVLVVDSIHSTGKLISDVDNNSAKVFADNPGAMRYVYGRITSHDPGALFASASWPED